MSFSSSGTLRFPTLPASERAATGPQLTRTTDARRLERRPVDLGQGRTVHVVVAGSPLGGEVVDLSAQGLGVVVFGAGPLPSVGDVVTVQHTGRESAGIRQTTVVRSVSKMVIGGYSLNRLGLATVKTRGREVESAARAAMATRVPARSTETVAPPVVDLATEKARRLTVCAKMMDEVVRGHRLSRASQSNDPSR